jgi:hypothetical protein
MKSNTIYYLTLIYIFLICNSDIFINSLETSRSHFNKNLSKNGPKRRGVTKSFVIDNDKINIQFTLLKESFQADSDQRTLKFKKAAILMYQAAQIVEKDVLNKNKNQKIISTSEREIEKSWKELGNKVNKMTLQDGLNMIKSVILRGDEIRMEYREAIK